MHHTPIKLVFTTFFILFSIGVFAQPSADFSVNKAAGCEPLTVVFTDLSTSPNGAITTWMWEANGSFFSSTQNPAFLLNNPGLYTICLTVNDVTGASNKSCKTDFIEVYSKPSASYTAAVRTGCAPLEVNFNSTATSANGAITSWIWDLGGPCGVIPGSTQSQVACTYTSSGTYRPTLIVKDEKGCENSITVDDFITVYPDPKIQVSGNATFSCNPPFSVLFSNDNPEPNTSYEWDFGNGQTFMGSVPPSVTYNTAGFYSVTVSAVNQTGCTSTLVLNDYIKVGYEVDFSFSSSGGCGDLNINFSDNSPDGASAIEFDFGDGNTSTFSNASHSYASPGCYDVTLSRTVNGCTNSLTQLLCISDAADLPVSMNVQNRLGCELPHTVNFEGISPVAQKWHWNFGDGTTSNEQNPTHEYTSFGTFPISLRITDPFGCIKTIRTDTVVISPIKVFVVDVPMSGCLPFSFSLQDSVDSVVPIVAWNWQIVDNNGMVVFTSNVARPTGILNQEGCFNIELTLENALGCTASKTFPSAICAGNTPTINFSATPVSACASESIIFTDMSDNSVNSWAWDFDSDGEFDSFESDPIYTYRDTGCFNVTLLVGSYGCFNQVTFPNYICIAPPVAKFRARLDCDAPFDRNFTNQSIGADSVFWDFGVLSSSTDTSSLLNPSFTFPSKDTFEVTMIAFNFAEGCSDTLQTDVIITELEAGFILRDDQGCAPMELELVNTSIDANRYLWTAAGANISPRDASEPTIVLPDAGEYSLQLIARDVNNCRDTFTYTPIFANELNAAFQSTQLTECLDVDVQFTDASTNLYATNIQWDWLFGDTIGTASGNDITYTFDRAGFIPTQLVVTDSWGCKDSIFVAEGVNINAPFADFMVDSFSCPELNLPFVNQSVGTNLSYNWDFGDGTTSTLENPSHQYPLGTYQASLTISTSNCMHTYSQEIIVESVLANFTIDPDYPPCPPATVNFNDFSVNAQDYLWSFGDNSGFSDQPSHIYNTKGVFDVVLIAIGGNENCRDTLMMDSLVFIQGPSGSFSFEVDNGCLPVEATFIGQSDRPYTYTWFLDDGNTILTDQTQADTIRYVYNEAPLGGFVPKLMLASTCDTILISPDTIFVSDLSIDFMASDTFLCDGENVVAFESLVETSTGTYASNWQFQSGSPATSDQTDVAVEYLQPGVFDVTLMVDNGECQDTITKQSYIEVVDFVSLFAEDQIICQGDTAQLTAVSNATEFMWIPASNISDPSVGDPLVFPTQTTDYLVTGNYRNCTTANDTVTVEVLPLPQVQYSPVRRYFPGQSLLLEVSPKDPDANYDFQWFPTDGLSCARCPNPTATLDTAITYTITITNLETGCITEVMMEVTELKSCPEDLIYMPNVFSPNEDGFNDDFKMLSSNIFEIDYLRVYDRWGALMWEGHDVGEGWDGTYRGKPVSPGVYVYDLVAPCVVNDSKITKKGSITVIR